MWRLMHLAVVLALIGSAAYAYSIKYETIYFAEEIVKTKHRIAEERDTIGMLRAEWAHLTRPERVQELAEKHLSVQPLQLQQIVRAFDLPERGQRGDGIAAKLDALGLGEPTATPRDAPPARGGATPR